MAVPRSTKTRALEIDRRLAELYPGTASELCALRHANPYELLVATILSAQCTDERVNMVMPAISKRFPDPEDLAAAPVDEVEAIIRSTGFYHAKAKSLIGMASGLVERFDSQVPRSLDDLVTLPGVGRKTANVIRSVAFGLSGLPVDTHVGRLARRLGLTTNEDADKVEQDLCRILPSDRWGGLSLRLILHGRRVCVARKPRCGDCLLADLCPSAPPEIRAERSRLRRVDAKSDRDVPEATAVKRPTARVSKSTRGTSSSNGVRAKPPVASPARSARRPK